EQLNKTAVSCIFNRVRYQIIENLINLVRIDQYGFQTMRRTYLDANRFLLQLEGESIRNLFQQFLYIRPFLGQSSRLGIQFRQMQQIPDKPNHSFRLSPNYSNKFMG